MSCWALQLKGRPYRTLHAAVAVGHKVYSFGGYSTGGSQIGVLVFNTISLCWVTLPPPSVTTESREHPLQVPSKRSGHTAVLIEDIIYIWGGFTDNGESCKVLYAFHVDTHRWFRPKVSGTVPQARRGHSACVLGKIMYIFGVFDKLTGYTNDIHKLDTNTMVWSLINTRGTPAPASECHSATIIGTKMFVFGGHGDQVKINEPSKTIRVFDTETNCWLSTPSAQLLPEGREGHSAFAYKGELYIFGGDNRHLCRSRTFYDVWKFNPETFCWMNVKPKGKGPCSRTYRMCCCIVGDRVIFFGGYSPDDLYILDLNPSLKTLCKLAVIQYGLENVGLPHDIRWELAAMTTNSSRKNRKKNEFRKTQVALKTYVGRQWLRR